MTACRDRVRSEQALKGRIAAVDVQMPAGAVGRWRWPEGGQCGADGGAMSPMPTRRCGGWRMARGPESGARGAEDGRVRLKPGSTSD